MNALLTVLLQLFVCLSCISSVISLDHIIVGSQTIRPGAIYKFTVMTSPQTRKFGFTLNAQIKNNASKILVQNAFPLQIGEYTTLNLLIPSIVPEDLYKLFIFSTSGLLIKYNQSLIVRQKVHSILIQTDKYLYKQGQIVNYRIIALSSNLKPYLSAVNISIYDSQNNLIVRTLNQQSILGVITGQFQLSDVTGLGQWKINAKTQLASADKVFEVAEYVLPKFEVKVDLPSFYLINENRPALQENLHIHISSQYTYEKPVQGYALISVKLANFFSFNGQFPIVISRQIQLVDGQGEITLSLNELKTLIPCSWGSNSLSYQTLFVEANVTEAVTGVVLSGNASVTCQNSRYQFQFLQNGGSYFKPGLSFTSYLQLQLTGNMPPLLDDISYPNKTLKFVAVQATFQTANFSNTQLQHTYLVQLTKSGIVPVIIETNANIISLNLQSYFLDPLLNTSLTAYEYATAIHTLNNKQLSLSIDDPTAIIMPKTSISFKVKSSEQISSFQYQVLSKGQIVISRIINEAKSTVHSYKVDFTDKMVVELAPEAKILVTCITSSKELLADSISLKVSNYLPNKVSLKFNSNSTEPSKNITLTVDAAAHSSVYLLGLDQSVLLLSASNDLTLNQIYHDLEEYDNQFSSGSNFFESDFFIPRWFGGSDTASIINNAGAIVFTNLVVYETPRPPRRFLEMARLDAMPMAFQLNKISDAIDFQSIPSGSSVQPLNVRSFFPETWIFSTVVLSDNTSTQISLQVPDTITSWITTAFAINQELGFGLTNAPTKLTVIKPFFVSLNLPFSIVRGEEFELQATIFNYFGADLNVSVILPASLYFNVGLCESTGFKSLDVIKNIQVSNNNAKTVYFWIVPNTLGQIPIQVNAIAGVAGDAIKATVVVKPEGQPQSYSNSLFIRLGSDTSDTYTTDLNVNLPPNSLLVSGSQSIIISTTGDILLDTLQNLGNLVQLPSGCGEQNMINLAPDVFALKYIYAIKNQDVVLFNDNPTLQTIADKALHYIFTGYQTELTFKRKDGSFSAFGNSDPSGSVWLTAFVIRVFVSSTDYIPMNNKIILEAINWIIINQTPSGSFIEPPNGRVIHTDMQGGASNGLALSAYVTISLLKAQKIAQYESELLTSSVKKAVGYLESSYTGFNNDPYTLSIIAYAFYLADSSELSNIIAILDGLATEQDGLKYWTKTSNPNVNLDVWIPPYSPAKSFNTEMTSYMLMIYASRNDLINAVPIAKWIIKQRSISGGFTSTQDTVTALEALAIFAPLVAQSSDSSLLITLKSSENDWSYEFTPINKQSAFILQSVKVPNVNQVTVSAQGNGFAVVQLSVAYNVKSADEGHELKLNLTTNSITSNQVKVTVCTSWLGNEISGMVLIDFDILTGYNLVNLEDLQSKLINSSQKIEQSSTRVSIYLNQLTADALCFDVILQQFYTVNNVSPALVKVYSYYVPSTRISRYYSVRSKSNWISSCPECCEYL